MWLQGLGTPDRVGMGWHWAAQQPGSPVVSNLSPRGLIRALFWLAQGHLPLRRKSPGVGAVSEDGRG